MGRIILPRNMEVVIASFGGVGTTFLHSFLAQHKETNHLYDADNLKHSPLPPVSFSDNAKFIYVYGNPQLAAISIFRRNIQHPQSVKLQKWSKETISPIPEGLTLQEYASQGIDKFYFRNHFLNWYDKYLASHPTMFIRYETIFDNIAPLLNFLDIPKSSVESFPKKKIRTSTIENISVETLRQLDHMYGSFSDELAKLEDVEIRERTDRRVFATTYLKSPYLKAFAEQAPFELNAFLKNRAPKIYTTLQKIKQLKNRPT